MSGSEQISSTESLAIVGMSCRFPGGVGSPEDLWRVVADEREVLSPFPDDRGWDLEALHGPGGGVPGTAYVDRGGFLDGVAEFDPAFFGISPREALAMDPQQRLLLETAWEALERASLDPAALRGTRTGVFVGAEPREYGPRLHQAPDGLAGYLFTGTTSSVMSGRVAYLLGLEGPALTIDTSASSSLVAIHLAAESLRRGECTLAIAGGVSTMANPGAFVAFSALRGLAPDGRCKPFSADADGTAWSEGAGLIVVERLSDAVRNGHRVLALLRGSAINSDGASDTLTSPNDAAQQAVIGQALAAAGLDRSDIDVVEAHGTGTPLGDATEARALLAAYGSGRPADRPLRVGSVKGNIGHTLAAAGAAGVIKTVMAMRHGLAPRSLHIGEPSPHVDWQAGNVRLLTEVEPWPESDRPARAGVSSFGISGTNAHVILEAAPSESTTAAASTDSANPAVLSGTEAVAWPVAGRSEAALADQAGRLAEYSAAHAETPAGDVAWSLATTRSAFDHRAVVVGTSRDELESGLSALAENRPAPGLVSGAVAPDADGGTVFVFPGQGSQWQAMGRELMECSPVFAARLDECAEALAPYLDWSVRDVLAGTAELDAIDVIQPALWAMMVSLAAVWQAAGVTPDAVVGTSQGEIAAACVAGILSLEDAARIVALRSKALKALVGKGAMLSVAESAERVTERLEAFGDRMSVAVVNGSAATVVAGDPEAIEELAAICEADGVRARAVPSDVASHCAQVDVLEDEIHEVLAGLAPRPGRIPMRSSMSGEHLAGPELDAGYWFASMRARVEFDRTLRALIDDGHRYFIEVSPHPVLTGAITGTLDDAGVAATLVTGTLRRDEGGPARLLAALAEAHVNGMPVDWTSILAPAAPIDLPTYAFQHERYWLTDTTAAETVVAQEPEAVPDASLRRRLEELPEDDQVRVVLDLVRTHAAAILGHTSPTTVEDRSTFKKLGFDSVTAVDLRNRLNAAVALTLPQAVVYDHPTPASLANFLRAEILGIEEPDGDEVAFARAARTDDDPIVIVGMSCRLPGDVRNPADLWNLVSTGASGVGDYPDDRDWGIDSLTMSDPDGAGDTHVRSGGFVYDVAEFDAGFFGISPREALTMDPQQRILLEVTWEALEQAGIDPLSLHGTRTGVFTGTFASEYGGGLPNGVEQDSPETYMMTGTATSVISGRVSYALGLEGPAVTLDTACSASLVALHLACQSLASGESALALVGGATVHATAGWMAWFAAQRGLAPDGESKAYSDDADGVGMAEGAGVLVVERLSDARRNGHQVLAVVRGSAVNQDGASNGLTAPSGLAQQRVIRAALADAGLEPSDVDVIEGHGTGTRLGDPIEVQALMATYGRDRAPDRPLLLGSVKSNFGHPMAAAGVAGVVKLVESIRHGVVPATLNVGRATSAVDWSGGGVVLTTEATPWPETGRVRRAGVSSFGISGTNAHVLIEQAPENDAPEAGAPETRPDGESAEMPVVVWPVSGRGGEGLKGQAGRLAEFVDGRPELDVADVGWSLVSTRAGLEERAVVLGADRVELLEGLDALAAGGEATNVTSGQVTGGEIGFVFSGQGAQRLGMGRELYAAYPVFARAFDEACNALDKHLDRSVSSVVHGDDADLVNQTVWAQSGLFAIEVALCELLASWGVRPQVVGGHSIGELAAAYVAGVWSLDDAASVVAARGRLMQALPSGGAMLAVNAPESVVTKVLADCGDPRVGIAAVNAADSVVVSGAVQAIDTVVECLHGLGVRSKRLSVSHAFHSPLMEPMLAEFQRVVSSVTLRRPGIALVSGLTGSMVTDEVTDPAYWVRHVREAVRFADAVEGFRAADVRTFVEVGPDAALTPMVAASSGEAWLPLLRRGRPEPGSLLGAVAGVWVRGGEVDWRSLYAGTSAARVDLPTYAFQRRHYWMGPGGRGERADAAGLGMSAADHPLLGAAVELAGGEGLLLTGRLSLGSHPWLADHVVAGTVIVPGTALVEMAVRAGDEAGCARVAELVIEAPLVMPDSGGTRIQVSVGAPDEDGRRELGIYACADDGDQTWVRHAFGALESEVAPVSGDAGMTQWPPAGAEPVGIEDFYPTLAQARLEYGPVFRGVRAVWLRDTEVFAEVALPDGVASSGFGMHPALLDAALQTIEAGDGSSRRARVPFAWTDVAVHAVDATTARVRVAPADGGVSVTLADATGGLLASVGSLSLRELSADALDPGAALARQALFTVEWQQAPVSPDEADTSGWAVLGSDDRLELTGVPRYADLPGLVAAVGSGATVPRTVVAITSPDDAVLGTLALVQAWLAEETVAAARLVVVTERAVDAGPDAPVRLESAGAWGLLRVAIAENPGRILAVDVDDPAGAGRRVAAAAGVGEPELAVRGDQVRVPRLVRAGGGLTPPEGASAGDWRLGYEGQGTLECMRLIPSGDREAELAPGQVRVGMRAAGVNFRDVLTVLGVYPGPAGPLGLEGAGVILEVGPGVSGFEVGDAVMGIFTRAFGSVVVADPRMLIHMPSGWTFAQAAGAPVAFATAWHGLVELAGLGADESVLVHAAAGGVGIAAVQLAQHLGARVFGTASLPKWDIVRGLGVPQDRIASSRNLDFEFEFGAETARPMDVVLNSLAGEFVDASLRLTAEGGRFVEMGKTDVRSADDVQKEYGVSYQAFDLLESGPERIGAIFGELSPLFSAGGLRPLPVTCWDVRHAAEAFRFLSQGRNIGKVVLTLPAVEAAEASGSALVTGASGALGALVAGHLAANGAPELVLTSRRGPMAGGVAGLAADLATRGTAVRVLACDVAERDQLSAVLDGLAEAGSRVSSVVHTAGVLDDALVTDVSAERVKAVLRPKIDGVRNLHELTAGLGLDSFVVFSSVAGVWGSAGQGAYAAANTFLDALAAKRRREGLPAVSIAWGPWRLEDTSGMTAALGRADWERMARQGLRPLSGDDGLALLDRSADGGSALVVAARLDLTRMASSGDGPSPLLSRLVRKATGRRTAGTGGSQQDLATRLSTLSPAEQNQALLDILRSQTALVLGIPSPQAVDSHRSFRDLGFDSLTSVELRNRLNTLTGLQLPATMIFDHPTPDALAARIGQELIGAPVEEEAPALEAFSELEKLEASVERIVEDEAARLRFESRLRAILTRLSGGGAPAEAVVDDLDSASDDDMFDFIDKQLGT